MRIQIGVMILHAVCALRPLALNRRHILASAISTGFAVNPTATHASQAPRVRLYGDIDVASCAKLVDELEEADDFAQQIQLPICLHIQSLGGEVMPLLYVLDVIDRIDSPVYTFVDGYAASAASLLAVYGARRFISKRSAMLIHELRFTLSGTYSQALLETAHVEKMQKEMQTIYLERTNMTQTNLHQLMTRDIWLTSDVCLAHGIVDTIR